jgi:hypothetical protein
MKILVTGFQEAFADKDYLAVANAKQTLQPVPPAGSHKRRNVQNDPEFGLLLVILGGFAVLFLLVTKDYGATATLFPASLRRPPSSFSLSISAGNISSRGVELHRFSCAAWQRREIIITFCFQTPRLSNVDLSLSRSLRRFGSGSRRSGRGQFSSVFVDRRRILSDFYAYAVAQFVCLTLAILPWRVFEVRLRRGTTRWPAALQHTGEIRTFSPRQHYL